MTEITGVAFPIPKQFVQRFFEGRDVFVKPATVFKELGTAEPLVSVLMKIHLYAHLQREGVLLNRRMLECSRCGGRFNHYVGVTSRGRHSEFVIRVRPRATGGSR
jgi:hypothetical protein